MGFAVNALLFFAKASIAATSGSLVVYASALDSALDLMSGMILLATKWLQQKEQWYRYPIGNSRMEPMGTVVFATVMITCYVQVFGEGIQKLIIPNEIICTPQTII